MSSALPKKYPDKTARLPVDREIGQRLRDRLDERFFEAKLFPRELLNDDRKHANQLWLRHALPILTLMARRDIPDLSEKFPNKSAYLAHHFPKHWEVIRQRLEDFCKEEGHDQYRPEILLDTMAKEIFAIAKEGHDLLQTKEHMSNMLDGMQGRSIRSVKACGFDRY